MDSSRIWGISPIIKSARDGSRVSLAGLIETRVVGRPAELLRVDRLPAVTMKATLAPGASLGDVVSGLEAAVRVLLPPRAQISWLGASQDYRRGSQDFRVAFALALAFGPGAETRSILGLVIMGGVVEATLLTLFLVPVLYSILARHTKPRAALSPALAGEREEDEARQDR